jgi:hypothetical protein
MDILHTEKNRILIRKISSILLLCLGLLGSITVSSHADGGNAGWIDTKADPVSHEEAVKRLSGRIQEPIHRTPFKASALRTTGPLSAEPATDPASLLADLAHGLQNDPALIFDYVHNHIDYVPYFGALKGAALTMLDGSGNDFDQAALMVALLRHAGYPARFVYGAMSIPYEDLANWVGVDNNPALIRKALASGGIPGSAQEGALS